MGREVGEVIKEAEASLMAAGQEAERKRGGGGGKFPPWRGEKRRKQKNVKEN